MHAFPIEWVRSQFPALKRSVGENRAAYFDGPSGTQVPARVAQAVSDYLLGTNANRGGHYATAIESDAILDDAHRVVADFLGTTESQGVVFGNNMTTLTFALSRALARTWKTGDEVLVSQLDHDANVTPWVAAARDAGATVRMVHMNYEDGTLNLDDFASKLTSRTRLLAVGCASNILGTVNPVVKLTAMAREVGAHVFLDAVHYAPHALPDVTAWGCDYVACSAYKFFGPHVGILWGRPDLLGRLEPYKLRPAPDGLPGRWMTGTQNHEGIAGTVAAIEYLSDLGRQAEPAAPNRRAALEVAYTLIGKYEGALTRRLLDGLAQLNSVRVFGIRDANRSGERMPTIAFRHNKRSPAEVTSRLGRQGLFLGHGNFYALQVTEALRLEPEGLVRAGIMHYSVPDDIDRLVYSLAALDDGRGMQDG